MSIEVLVLNTAAADLRRPDFDFVDALVGEGGLAKCPTKDMPDYSQQQLHTWIEQGCATAGGPGNTAPLMARAGIKTAVGVNLGQGDYDGLDACGRYWHDVMTSNGVDMSATLVHKELPSGLTFIHDRPADERGGIAYFPNANNDFDFERFKREIERLGPKVVHYMYSGLSERGDANGGGDLAEFIQWCRGRGIITLVDSHTLAGDPAGLIASGAGVEDYRLLEPLLGEVDIFFTSADESKMIENTLGSRREWDKYCEHANCVHFLDFLAERFWQNATGTRVFGVTVGNGAYQTHRGGDGGVCDPAKTSSRFMAGGTVDLIGAGDSFRAGLLSYVAKNAEAFKKGSIDFEEAVQMGNLMASLYVKAPLDDRYGNIPGYDKLLEIVRNGVTYDDFDELLRALEN